MQTIFRLKASDLPDLVAVLKTLFKKEKVIEIAVNTVSGNTLEKKETKKEYWAKLNKRLKNLDKGQNLVSFTGEEFERFVAERTEKYGKKK